MQSPMYTKTSDSLLQQDHICLTRVASHQVWKSIPFEFTLQNLSNVPLVCKVHKLPAEVTIDCPTLQKENEIGKESKKCALCR